MSILLLFLRIFQIHIGTRRATYVGIVLTFLVFLFTIISDAVNRAPAIGKPWTEENLTRNDTVQPTINIIVGYLNLALDIMIFCIPIKDTWSLNVGLRWKVKMMGIFGTGLL